MKAVHYSGAAYCKYEAVDMWECGPHCQANPGLSEIKRLISYKSHIFGYTGYDATSNKIVVAFRGTNGPDLTNWITNFDGKLIPYQFLPTGKVHNGFMSAFSEVQQQMRSNLRDLIEHHYNAQILVTGHSLGGALATLAALDIYYSLGVPPTKMELYTFGQPRAVDEVLSNELMTLFSDNYHRVTHYDDAVVHVPLTFQGFKHAGEEVWYLVDEFTKGQYKICVNYIGKEENQKCSQSIILKTGIPSHVKYLGVRFAEGCFQRQPSGTLMEESFLA